MKKFLLMLLCGALMLSIVACNSDKKTGGAPAGDPPAWEELIEECDEWSSDYVNFKNSYKANPNSPVVMDSIGRWMNEIDEWWTSLDEMLEALGAFKTEKAKFLTEVKKITAKMSGDVSTDAAAADVEAFLDEYDTWAEDTYLAFFEEFKDDKVSQDYRDGYNDRMVETISWSVRIYNMKLRITDATLLNDFENGIDEIAGKLASANN